MAVDDHAIDNLRNYFNAAYEDLKKEWKSNEYTNLSECPSFKTAYTYKEAMSVLINGPKYVDETQLMKMIDEELETENFWKEKSSKDFYKASDGHSIIKD